MSKQLDALLDNSLMLGADRIRKKQAAKDAQIEHLESRVDRLQEQLSDSHAKVQELLQELLQGSEERLQLLNLVRWQSQLIKDQEQQLEQLTRGHAAAQL